MTPEQTILQAVHDQIEGTPAARVLEGLPRRAVLAGGWPLAAWQGRVARDLDIFVNPSDYKKAKELFGQYLQPDHETANGATYLPFGLDENTVQIIRTRKFTGAFDLVNSFDIDASQVGVYFDAGQFRVAQMSLCAAAWESKRIALVNCADAPDTLMRLFKYAHYGFEVAPAAVASVLDGITWGTGLAALLANTHTWKSAHGGNGQSTEPTETP